MKKSGGYFVYFLQSTKHGRIYTGRSEKDPQIRLVEHNYGTNNWTKQNGPFRLIYFEKYCCKDDMAAREKFFKSGFGRRIRNAILSEVLKNNTQFPPEADQPMAGVRAPRCTSGRSGVRISPLSQKTAMMRFF
ncbi:GIY-YIG nuclease family protein [Patescibacteria group bacterium]|nr:GIY-YIG nuclease family protein [Patescibacteria group bacterium]